MKKALILFVVLLFACGIGVAQTFISKYKNELAIREDMVVYLKAHCDDTENLCLYRCPVCRRLYEAVGKKGPLTDGPESCGCGSGSGNNPGTGTINP